MRQDQQQISRSDRFEHAMACLDRASECRRWAREPCLTQRIREDYSELARSYEIMAGELDPVYAREIWLPHRVFPGGRSPPPYPGAGSGSASAAWVRKARWRKVR
jgi:hypothetical protein